MVKIESQVVIHGLGLRERNGKKVLMGMEGLSGAVGLCVIGETMLAAQLYKQRGPWEVSFKHMEDACKSDFSQAGVRRQIWDRLCVFVLTQTFLCCFV